MSNIFRWMFYYSDLDVEDDMKVISETRDESTYKIKKLLYAHSSDIYMEGYFFEWDEKENKGVIYNV